jgi:hypothetical protein
MATFQKSASKNEIAAKKHKRHKEESEACETRAKRLGASVFPFASLAPYCGQLLRATNAGLRLKDVDSGECVTRR